MQNHYKMKENEGHIFRYWTWKKFFSFLLFYTLLFILVGMGLDLLLSKGNFTVDSKKTLVECTFQAFVFACLSTLWTPDKETIFTLLKRKLTKK